MCRRRRNRAAQIERQVHPRFGATCAGEIFSRDVPPSGPQSRVIGNHQLAMIAQIPATGRAETKERMEHRDPPARIAQRREGRIASEPRARTVDQEA